MSVRVFASAPLGPLDELAGSELELDAAESHYLARVRRRSVGDEVEVLDGRGGSALAVIVALDRKASRLRIEGPAERRPAPSLRLACALIDPKAMLEVVGHATEFGAASLSLIRCERSTFDPPGQRRIESTIRAAQRQSGRAMPLMVDGPLTLPELIAARGDDETWLVADRNGDPPRPPVDSGSLLLVGPEGGFTAAEAELLAGAGASPLSLSDHVLRAPTACLSGLSVLHALGRSASQT